MFENSYLLLPVAGQLPPWPGVPPGAGDLVAPDRDEASVVLVSPFFKKNMSAFGGEMYALSLTLVSAGT